MCANAITSDNKYIIGSCGKNSIAVFDFEQKIINHIFEKAFEGKFDVLIILKLLGRFYYMVLAPNDQFLYLTSENSIKKFDLLAKKIVHVIEIGHKSN